MQKASRLGMLLLEKRYSPDSIYADCRFEQKNLRRGEMLYAPAERGRYIYLVESGLLKLEYFLPDGAGRIVRLIGTQQLAGIEIFAQERYEHYAQALSQTSLLMVPVALLKRLQANSKAIRYEVYRLFLQVIEETDNWIRLFTSGSARQRLAWLLLKTHPESHVAGLLLHYDDIGSIIGVRPETVCRVMQNLRQLGAVRDTGPGQVAVDRDKLQLVASLPGSAPLMSLDTSEKKAG